MTGYTVREDEQEHILSLRKDECRNSTSPTPAGYCPHIWDRIMCWTSTPPGHVAVQPCAPYIAGFKLAHNASKKCEADGQWYKNPTTNQPWTNYSLCWNEQFTRELGKITSEDIPKVVSDYFGTVQTVSQIGYAISLVTLIVAFFTLASFKRLRCPRNILHLQLFTSFMMRSLFSLLKTALFSTGFALPKVQTINGETSFTNDAEKIWTCKIILTCWQYFQVANYAWLFMEGLYLHNLIFLALFSGTSSIYVYTFFGWGMPLFFVTVWVILRIFFDNHLCWTTNDNLYIYSIIRVPIIISILLNFCMFINIVRVLMLKLRASMSEETQRLRRWAKSTLVLVPLLGVQYVLSLAISAVQNDRMHILWLFFDQLFGSLQGCMVAILYCFMNSEVQEELRQLITRLRCCRRKIKGRVVNGSRDFQEMNTFSLKNSNSSRQTYLPVSSEGKYSVRFTDSDNGIPVSNSRKDSGNDGRHYQVGLLSEENTCANHNTGGKSQKYSDYDDGCNMEY